MVITYVSVAFFVPAMVLSALLLVDSSSMYTSGVVEIKKVRRIFYASFFEAAVYFVEYNLLVKGFYGSRTIGMVIDGVLFIANLYCNYTFADMVFSKYYKQLYKKAIARLVYSLPFIILCILYIVNMFTPIFYNIDPQSLEYSETAWLIVPNIVCCGYFALAVFNDIREAKQNTHYYPLPISIFFSIAILGMFVESIFTDLLVLPICFALSVTFMYIRIVKRIGYIDDLSGLFSRTNLNAYILVQLDKLKTGQKLMGLMIDINHFKSINDTYGHVAGDRAIQAAGSVFRSVTKKHGTCFRYGGDEFIIIMRVYNTVQIHDLMDRIEFAVAEFNAKKLEEFELEVSQGYALCDQKLTSVIQFLERMDEEMYRHKYKTRHKTENV